MLRLPSLPQIQPAPQPEKYVCPPWLHPIACVTDNRNMVPASVAANGDLAWENVKKSKVWLLALPLPLMFLWDYLKDRSEIKLPHQRKKNPNVIYFYSYRDYEKAQKMLDNFESLKKDDVKWLLKIIQHSSLSKRPLRYKNLLSEHNREIYKSILGSQLRELKDKKEKKKNPVNMSIKDFAELVKSSFKNREENFKKNMIENLGYSHQGIYMLATKALNKGMISKKEYSWITVGSMALSSDFRQARWEWLNKQKNPSGRLKKDWDKLPYRKLKKLYEDTMLKAAFTVNRKKRKKLYAKATKIGKVFWPKHIKASEGLKLYWEKYRKRKKNPSGRCLYAMDVSFKRGGKLQKKSLMAEAWNMTEARSKFQGLLDKNLRDATLESVHIGKVTC